MDSVIDFLEGLGRVMVTLFELLYVFLTASYPILFGIITVCLILIACTQLFGRDKVKTKIKETNYVVLVVLPIPVLIALIMILGLGFLKIAVPVVEFLAPVFWVLFWIVIALLVAGGGLIALALIPSSILGLIQNIDTTKVKNQVKGTTETLKTKVNEAHIKERVREAGVKAGEYADILKTKVEEAHLKDRAREAGVKAGEYAETLKAKIDAAKADQRVKDATESIGKYAKSLKRNLQGWFKKL